MSGASTGSLIVLLLNVPDQEGKPKYSVSDALALYKDLGDDVFHNSLWHRITSVMGVSTK